MKPVAGLLLMLMVWALQASGADRVSMQPIHHLRKGVAAWVLIANPRTEGERRISDHLASLNASLAAMLRECDKNYAEIMREDFGKERMGGDLTKRWMRTVEVTMRGPIYLSEIATDSFFCGGAHPDTFTYAAVFNLDTGEPVDPLVWFKQDADASRADETSDPGLENSTVVPTLVPIYKELTHHDCDSVFSESEPFLIWPDERSGRVMVQADVLPGSAEACGVEAGLTADQARKVGFDEQLLTAIDQAHRTWTGASHPPRH